MSAVVVCADCGPVTPEHVAAHDALHAAEAAAPRHRAHAPVDSCSRRHSRWLICERCAGSYGWSGYIGRHRGER